MKKPKQMPRKTPHMGVRKALESNVRRLMDIHDLSGRAMARRVGTSSGEIQKILRCESGASIDIIGRIANAFGLTYWQVVMPDLPDALLRSPALGELHVAFVKASPEGRLIIEAIAQREAQHAEPRALPPS